MWPNPQETNGKLHFLYSVRLLSIRLFRTFWENVKNLGMYDIIVTRKGNKLLTISYDYDDMHISFLGDKYQKNLEIFSYFS